MFSEETAVMSQKSCMLKRQKHVLWHIKIRTFSTSTGLPFEQQNFCFELALSGISSVIFASYTTGLKLYTW